MSIHRSVLPLLVLIVATPSMMGPHYVSIGKGGYDFHGNRSFIDSRLRITTPSGKVIVKSIIKARVSSDAGDEDVDLVESDAWLHGAASLKELPKTEATLTLTLYDEGSASLMSFSGTLGTDGAVALTADETATTCELLTKTGCTGDTSATTLDIEVLAGEVFAASGGYELGLDLAGADTYEVAYATIVVTESTEVTTCDKVKGCTTTGSTTTTKAEVGWDEIGSVWEGELTVEPEGVVDVKVKTYDETGEAIDSTKVALGVPWIDGGDGVNVLALDEDPLTTVGLLPLRKWTHVAVTHGLAITSGGWTTTTAPVAAEVELTEGGTITIPVNSYQRRQKPDFYVEDIRFKYGFSTARIVVNGSNFNVIEGVLESAERGTPVCDNGTCLTLAETEEGDVAMSVSVYGEVATKLPDDAELVVTLLDEAGKETTSTSATVEFDDEITAVFANEISLSTDPVGVDLGGTVSLLGAADEKGKQKTLAKGKFYGSFSRDGDGDLSLAGADKEADAAKGDILIGGEPIGFELNGPPVVASAGEGNWMIFTR